MLPLVAFQCQVVVFCYPVDLFLYLLSKEQVTHVLNVGWLPVESEVVPMHWVFLRWSPDSDKGLVAGVSDTWVVAALDDALASGRPEYVAWGDVARAAILAVMWIHHVPKVYAGGVQVNQQGPIQWHYHIDCSRKSVLPWGSEVVE